MVCQFISSAFIQEVAKYNTVCLYLVKEYLQTEITSNIKDDFVCSSFRTSVKETEDHIITLLLPQNSSHTYVTAICSIVHLSWYCVNSLRFHLRSTDITTTS